MVHSALVRIPDYPKFPTPWFYGPGEISTSSQVPGPIIILTYKAHE